MAYYSGSFSYFSDGDNTISMTMEWGDIPVLYIMT